MPNRSFDAARIASLAHAPDAIEWLCCGQELDWEAILSHDESNILSLDETTGAHALFQYRGPRLWEGHIVCPIDIRGRSAIDASHRLLTWFDENIGGTLFAKSFAANRRVAWFMPRIGFRYVETRDGQAFFERT